jgi:hypothetical protein
MAYSSSSGSTGDATGTKAISLRVTRVRNAAAALFNQSHFTKIEALEVVGGDTGLVLDQVLVNTTRFANPFVVGSGKLRIHRAWLDAPRGTVKKIYISANGVRIAELDVSGYSGSFNAIIGVTVDGDSAGDSKPARSRGARLVKLPEASLQPPSANEQDVVVFYRGGTDVGTIDVDRQLEGCLVQTDGADPPGGAPPDGLPGPIGEFPQARQTIITQADNAGVSRTRNRVLLTDGDSPGPEPLRVVDTIDRRVTRWSVNNAEVYGSRLVEIMGDRVYLLAPKGNLRMWYASALKPNGVGLQPHLNYDLSDLSLLPEERANAGTNPRVGAPPYEIVLARALSNRRLLMGGSGSCSILDDDPGFGGQVREASRSLGVLGPDSGAFDGSNNFYVMTPEGMAVIASGSGTLEQVSGERLSDILDNIDINRNRIAMGYRADEKTIHIAITPRSGLEASTVVIFDTQRNGFWRDTYPLNYGPTVLLSSGGRSELSRNLLLCGFDGGIRRYVPDRDRDEDAIIDSYVRTAPFESPEGTERMMVDRLIAIGTTRTAAVRGELRVDESCEDVAAQLLTSPARRTFDLFTSRKGAQRGVGLRQRGAAHQIVIRRSTGSGGGKWEWARIVVIAGEAGRRKSP